MPNAKIWNTLLELLVTVHPLVLLYDAVISKEMSSTNVPATSPWSLVYTLVIWSPPIKRHITRNNVGGYVRVSPLNIALPVLTYGFGKFLFATDFSATD